MKARYLIGLAAVAVLLCSCIPSLNPFYTEKDVVFDPRLLGTWEETEKPTDGEVWTFERPADEKFTLALTVQSKGKEGKFAAHLFKLKNEHFLDLIPTDVNFATNQADLVAFSIFPGHLLLRLQLDTELKLALTDFEWLEKYLEKNPKALEHHREGQGIILTAESRDLQKFVLKHLGTNELFKGSTVMVRKSK